MFNIPNDTSADAERKQIELLRKATPARRLQLTCSLSGQVLAWSWEALRRTHPQMSECELRVRFAEIHYGRDIAALVKRYANA